MSVPERIIQLMDTFGANLETYKKGAYNETQLRREYIDPFFEALGWDVTNRQGYAEAYKDVIHEDAIKVGGVTKAPDYCFRIGGARKFFLEAKKPAVNIRDDIHPAYQLRRYGWSAKLPVSILTDFEEFAVYDCRVKPSPRDKASHSRILYLTYTDYARKWDDIYRIFARESILKGAFDKYALSGKGKRGTTEVDTAFLQEIERWRELLARNIARRNPALTQRELNYAVQQTIDRIVFLRICEDRGIESYGRLMALQNGARVYQRLNTLFREADAKYNSGLFHFSREKGRENFDDLTPGLTVDDTVLKDIFKNLYYPDSPYEFSVLPSDILGQVYERFLGKVIRLTPGNQAKIEAKPEVRKAGGVYYTPTYIVEYIVSQTVGALLAGKKPASRHVTGLTILDPACGSGSFLLGAYEYLLNWYRDQYLADTPEKWTRGKTPRLYQAHTGDWRLTTDERKRILLSHIYGVDIDSQAVEVTKLSLLLKVLEGEDEQSIGRQMALFQERVLPDLAHNIKCGNSLIGPDFYAGRQMELLDEAEMYRVNVFDWPAEFAEIMGRGGFDVVIGNPPYVLITHDDEKGYLQKKYKFSKGKPDLYRFFVERSLNICKLEGSFGFIIPSTLLTIPSGESLRKYLLDSGGLVQLVNFRGEVFTGVSVNSLILIVQKDTKLTNIDVIEDQSLAPSFSTLETAVLHKRVVDKKVWLNNEQCQIHLSSSIINDRMIDKIRDKSKYLSIYAQYTLGMQVYHNSIHKKHEIKNRIYHSSVKKDETYWPASGGRNVKRYFFNNTFTEYVAYGDWCYNRPTWNFCSVPRILIREIPDKSNLVCAKTDSIHVSSKAVIVVIPEKVEVNFLLGILNSKLIGFYVRSTGEKGNQRLFPRISLTTMRKLPIPTINFSNSKEKKRYDEMTNLVIQIIILNQKLATARDPQARNLLQRQIDATDRQIDQLVYKLYDLTAEEISIVEAAG